MILNCGSLRVATPSFFDEIVKQVLVEASADRLEILRPTARARELAEKSADNRGVASRLSILEPAL